jgi:hypothetical protein
MSVRVVAPPSCAPLMPEAVPGPVSEDRPPWPEGGPPGLGCGRCAKADGPEVNSTTASRIRVKCFVSALLFLGWRGLIKIG